VLVTIRVSSFQSNASDFVGSRHSGREPANAAIGDADLSDERPEPTVFRLRFCSDVLRPAATSRQNFVCDACDRGALLVDRKRAPHAVTAKWRGCHEAPVRCRSIAPSPANVKLT
jgi:hypothetical protein